MRRRKRTPPRATRPSHRVRGAAGEVFVIPKTGRIVPTYHHTSVHTPASLATSPHSSPFGLVGQVMTELLCTPQLASGPHRFCCGRLRPHQVLWISPRGSPNANSAVGHGPLPPAGVLAGRRPRPEPVRPRLPRPSELPLLCGPERPGYVPWRRADPLVSPEAARRARAPPWPTPPRLPSCPPDLTNATAVLARSNGNCATVRSHCTPSLRLDALTKPASRWLPGGFAAG